MSISLLFPFFFYSLWDWTFLPDQNKYASIIYQVRNLNFNEINLSYSSLLKVHLSSILMALFPIPFVNTIVSVSLINRSLLSLIILFFIKNKKLSLSLILILLFSPSIIVISSVALRDTITLIFALMFVYYFFNKINYIKSLIFLILLILTKLHLALFILFISFLYYLLFYLKKNLLFKIIVISLFLPIFFYYSDEIVLKISNIRYGFENEEFIYKTYFVLGVEENTLKFSIILYNFLNFFYSPLLTNSVNLIGIVIFIESLILFLILVMYLFKIYKNSKSKAIFIILSYIILSILLSNIVHNSGSLWRYKLSIQIIFVFISYFVFCKKNYKIL